MADTLSDTRAPAPAALSSHAAPLWTVRPPAPPHAVERLVRDLSVPPLLAAMLWGRGLREEALDALQPPLVLSPIPALREAAERLAAALHAKKRILIHGDYDADGMSGTAVLTLGLRALGGNITPFLPNRLTDGYGVSPARVPEHTQRADLFITVDCGISNLAEVEAIQAAGVEVIVTDHHHPGQTLPDCLVVHPTLSPFAQKGLPELTGAGVAFHLLWALHEHLGLEPPLEYSDIAAIGTIADVAPLMGENRALVREGLTHLSTSRWAGLRATLARTMNARVPTARDVAFVLAPRLNAAGRMGEAELGLELLTTASERRARVLAAYLDTRNSDRRAVQDKMFKEALSRVDPDAPALILHSDDWHPGVMGIVASKLLEHFYKPVFIAAKGKGSVRSTPGISAVGGLTHARETLERFGGHSQAAGFAIRKGNLEAFRERIFDYVGSFPTPRPRIVADALLTASSLDRGLLEAIDDLEPFGQGHPAPVFALTDRVDMSRAVGSEGRHLQLRIAGLKGVSWGRGAEAEGLNPGLLVNAAVSLRENEWQGKKSLEFVADALRPAERMGFDSAEKWGKGDETSIYRGKPPEEHVVAVYSAVGGGESGGESRVSWRPGDSAPKMLWLRDLPLDEAPLTRTRPLETLVADRTLYFDLTEEVLGRLECLARQYPTVRELRGMFVLVSRGQASPFDEVKTDLCMRALQELELLDEHGRARKGQKRDPYTSDTLRKGLLEGHKLSTFVSAYRHLDDASFARTVQTLFGPTARGEGARLPSHQPPYPNVT